MRADTTKVYFMHIGGDGSPTSLAAGGKAVWDAIEAVRAAHPQPAEGFGGIAITRCHDAIAIAIAIAKIVGHPVPVTGDR